MFNWPQAPVRPERFSLATLIYSFQAIEPPAVFLAQNPLLTREIKFYAERGAAAAFHSVFKLIISRQQVNGVSILYLLPQHVLQTNCSPKPFISPTRTSIDWKARIMFNNTFFKILPSYFCSVGAWQQLYGQSSTTCYYTVESRRTVVKRGLKSMQQNQKYLYSTHSSTLSTRGAYVTHNATRQPTASRNPNLSGWGQVGDSASGNPKYKENDTGAQRNE